MLVLSRKIGERIIVPGCELAFTVLAVQGKTVRVGVSAPAVLDVYREEVWQQLCQQTHDPPPKG
jgi:carbon storage regulator